MRCFESHCFLIASGHVVQSHWKRIYAKKNVQWTTVKPWYPTKSLLKSFLTSCWQSTSLNEVSTFKHAHFRSMMAPQSVFESIPEVGNCRIYSKMRHRVAFWKSSKSKVWCQMNFNNLRSFRNWAFCFTWSFCEEAAKFGEKRFEFYCKLCFGEQKKVRNDVKLTEKSLGLKWRKKLETLGKLEEYFSATIFKGCWNIRNIRAKYTKISSVKMSGVCSEFFMKVHQELICWVQTIYGAQVALWDIISANQKFRSSDELSNRSPVNPFVGFRGTELICWATERVD